MLFISATYFVLKLDATTLPSQAWCFNLHSRANNWLGWLGWLVQLVGTNVLARKRQFLAGQMSAADRAVLVSQVLARLVNLCLGRNVAAHPVGRDGDSQVFSRVALAVFVGQLADAADLLTDAGPGRTCCTGRTGRTGRTAQTRPACK